MTKFSKYFLLILAVRNLAAQILPSSAARQSLMCDFHSDLPNLLHSSLELNSNGCSIIVSMAFDAFCALVIPTSYKLRDISRN